ncbi:MAG: ribose 5-phosphate isomerase B [bacterium]|nr:ribose 5-phosphate isomerase B [bacterium]
MRIAIGSDHGGFELKEELKKFLKTEGYEVTDFGTNSSESVDYPYLTFNAAKSVANKENQFGIFICGSGVGASIVANKVHGIRAALCYNEEIARLSREHNNANFLCLGGRFLDKQEAFKIVNVWLKTSFSGGRHEKRVAQIEEIEKKN